MVIIPILSFGTNCYDTFMDLAVNKKVRFEYEIQEEFSAGIELFGFETKSVKNGGASIEGAHVVIRGGEAYLLNTRINPYQVNNTPKEYDPLRRRTLLLKKKEMVYLATLQKGLTLMPIAFYNSGTRIKLRFAIVKKKKLHDKREAMKTKEVSRSMRRTLKTGYGDDRH